jgi:hypothetical protein
LVRQEPDAAGKFSTTIGWPSRGVSLSAISRAIVSVPLPGLCGTISRIGRPGQLCLARGWALEERNSVHISAGRSRRIERASFHVHCLIEKTTPLNSSVMPLSLITFDQRSISPR